MTTSGATRAMLLHPSPAALALLAALVFPSCASFVEPDTGELYVLVEADGSALPIDRTTQGGVLVTLTADSVRILRDNRYERTTVVGATSSAAGSSSAPTETGVLVPEGNGFRMVSDDLCSAGGDCIEGDLIVFSAGGARIASSFVLAHATLQADGALRYAQR